MALARDWIPSPNYSDRGSGVRLVVIHTAEGSRTYQSLGAYFQGDVGVSSHVGIDDTAGRIGEYVPADGPGSKAWTQANANPYSVAAELCAFAAWTAAEWDAHPVMLENCAAWIAEECGRFAIPLVGPLTASEAQGGAAGVCDHASLGASGGGHWDVGSSFPWGRAPIALLSFTTKPTSAWLDSNRALPSAKRGRIWMFSPDAGCKILSPDGYERKTGGSCPFFPTRISPGET